MFGSVMVSICLAESLCVWVWGWLIGESHINSISCRNTFWAMSGLSSLHTWSLSHVHFLDSSALVIVADLFRGSSSTLYRETDCDFAKVNLISKVAGYIGASSFYQRCICFDEGCLPISFRQLKILDIKCCLNNYDIPTEHISSKAHFEYNMD